VPPPLYLALPNTGEEFLISDSDEN